MKKRLMAFISLIMSIMLGVVCLSGCRLITIDNNRDMDQIVATIKVNEEEENIYKKDLVMEYLNYGYLYVQYYGYTVEKTYNMIFENFVTSRILAQGAMIEFEEAGDIVDSSKAVGELERYLGETEILDAEYSTYSTINALLDSSEPSVAQKYQDSLIETVRTVPTDATVSEVELTDAEKKAYIEKGFDVNSTADRREAYNTVIEILELNNLLGENYNGSLESTEYFINSRKNYLESELLDKLDEKLSLEARQSLTFEDIEKEYEEAYAQQTEWSNSAFVSALGSASVGSPVLFSAFGSYGYVHNLLLGVNDEQQKQIESIRTNEPNISDVDYAGVRAEILGSTLVKDLRSSWILSGYDTEEVTNGNETNLIFTGDYTFAKDKANSLAFQGEYKKIREADEEKKTPAAYTVSNVYTYGLSDFVSFMDSYIGGTQVDNASAYSSLGTSIYGAKNLSDVSEYKAKINELLFAFSTDDGSLNTHDGYLIKPPVDGANSEEFVKTFGDAGRILLEQGTGYVIVASDYGYHIMFYSESFNIDYSVPTLVEYLNKESGENKTKEQWADYYESMISDWEEFAEENNYIYHVAETLTSAKVDKAVSSIERKIINTNRYEESDKVILYKDRFADLLK